MVRHCGDLTAPVLISMRLRDVWTDRRTTCIPSVRRKNPIRWTSIAFAAEQKIFDAAQCGLCDF
jgi:hypothetical protein